MKPDDIAAIRPLVPLFRWARANGYEHKTYQLNINSPLEHNWRTQCRTDEVVLWDDVLVYERHGVRLLTARPDSPEQIPQLLAVFGIGAGPRCGYMMRSFFDAGAYFCELQADHPGWHRDGTCEWTEPAGGAS